MAIRGRLQANRGIRQRPQITDKADIKGPYMGTMQAGPARPIRAHGLADEHQDRGLLYVEKKIWDDAIREFQKSVELSPDFSEGWNNLGLCYLYVDQVNEALEALQQAIRHFPGWHIAQANLGLAYQRAKQFDHAINHYRQSLNKQGAQPQVWYSLGETLESVGQIDEAITALRTAVTQHKRYDVALYRLGMLLARKSQFAEAEQNLREALSMDPLLAEAAAVLGSIAARQGRLDSARDYFQQARSAKPDQVPSAAAKGMVALEQYEQIAQKNLAELKAEFGELASISECLFNAGLAYVQSNNLPMARTSFESAALEDPEWAEPLIWLGTIDALEMRPGEARTHFDKALKLAPDNALAWETAAAACQVLGAAKDAERYFAEARKLGRDVADTQAQ